MTINLFLVLFTIGAAFSSLLTEAFKKALTNISSNILALYSASIVGALGMIGYYIINDVPFVPSNVVYIILMVICIWMGSMVGYDKVLQMIAQFRGGKSNE